MPSCSAGYNMTLPCYQMTAGESKTFIIPIYNYNGRQVDAKGMTARMAISDYVNVDMEPFVIKECSVISQDDSVSVLTVTLAPQDTLALHGKFFYQVTGRDSEDAFGVMKGLLYIYPNYDAGAISM